MQQPPLTEDLFKQAGALGVYSYYFQTSRDDFNQVLLHSPLKSPHKMSTNFSRPGTPTPSKISSKVKIPPTPVAVKQSSISSSSSVGRYISPVEIFNACLSNVGARDKIAKVLIYVLQIIGFHGKKIPELASKEFKFPSLLRLLLHPRLLTVFLTKQVLDRSGDAITAMNNYRQFLWTGGLPFSAYRFYKLVQASALTLLSGKGDPNDKLRRALNLWLNWKTMSQLASLYYSFTNDIYFLYKLGVIHHDEWPRFRHFCGSNTDKAWFATIITGLHNNYVEYKRLSREIETASIEYSVKSRAKELKGSESASNQEEYRQKITKLSEARYLVKLDLIRLVCDLIYDAVFVFNKPMYRPLHLLIGIISGSTGLYKICLQERKKLLQ